MMKTISRTLIASSMLVAFSGPAFAGIFSAGLPIGWTVVGNAGTSSADGDVGLAPGGGTSYGWVSTASGVGGAGALPGIGNAAGANTSLDITGSTLTSTLFSAAAGQNLRFQFNYITSDGAGYADYGWARLLNADNTPFAVLFTARTTPAGNSAPGFDLPPIAATLTPGVVTIPDVQIPNPNFDPSDPDSSPTIRVGPTWSPLGNAAGECFNIGCGLTGWIQSDFTIAVAGNYRLQFGVTNWNDFLFPTGLAFDGITVGGTPINEIPTTVIPVPASFVLFGSGLIGLLALRRKRRA
ncbi:MAG: NF038132 family protein [Burkholderiales bacterium]|nr:NF038132 family protein [Burkholderiales bacterium]